MLENLEVIKHVQETAGIDIILALKGFSMWKVFPLITPYLPGAAASSLNEAKLVFQEYGKKAHTYCVAYLEDEFEEVASCSSHLTFNSINQFEKFKERVPNDVKIGLRVNPEWSDVETDLYNPASEQSRLGVTKDQMPKHLPEEINGLHFHVLCESSAESLKTVLKNFEERFGQYLDRLSWVNMGGGHLITRKGYNSDLLIQTLKDFKEKYQVDVILEPGGAIAWETGDLYATVQDVVENGGVKTAICDISLTCHMPDCLEMPYRPRITGAQLNPEDGNFQYRIGGLSCLAGDYLSAYGFDTKLQPGDPIVFKDMMHYTMVKTSTFNGVGHPSIALKTRKGELKLLRKFTFDDYRNRLS